MKIRAILFPLCLLLAAGAAHAELPDLSITSSDITFNNDLPEPGETVTISAVVHNDGEVYFNTAPFASHDYQVGVSTRLTAVYNSVWYAQYFVPQTDITLVGKISLFIRNAAGSSDPTDPVTVEIRRDQGSALKPSPTAAGLVASRTLTVSSTVYAWQDFVFDDPPSLSANTTYWICMENYSTLGSNDGYGWYIDSGTPVDMLAGSIDQGQTWSGISYVAGNNIAYFRVYECTDTIISCFQGDPASGGTAIGTIVVSTPVPQGASTTLSFSWTAVAGSNDIYVAVDYPGGISESSEANNIASKGIAVLAVAPSIVGEVTPPEDAVGTGTDVPVRVVFNEDMEAVPTEQALSVRIVKDNRGAPSDISVTGTAQYGDKTLTFSSSWRKGCTYRVTLSTGARDLYGNGLSSPKAWTFSTLMDAGAENILIDGETQTAVTVPAGAIGGDYYVLIETDPFKEAALAARVAQANAKIGKIKGNFSPLRGSLRRFTLYRGAWPGTPQEEPFGSGVRITVPYTEVRNGVVEDGGGRAVKENTLALYRLDEQDNLWVKIPDSTIDTVNNTASAGVAHFSVYALLGGNDTDLSQAYAYPVPWKPYDGDDATGTPGGGITFTGLGSEATIRIYTLSGELVNAFRYSYTGGAEQQKWDGTNLQGEPAASGVYLYYIENGKERKTGKLIIIK